MTIVDRKRTVYAICMIVCMIISWVLLKTLGHQFIKAMFEGRAAGFLGGAIGGGNAAQPLESYIIKADALFVKVWITILGVFWLVIRARSSSITGFMEKHYRKLLLVISALFLIYACGMFLKPGFTESPIVQIDYSLHYADALESSFFARTSHKMWGYTPYHLAGYPSGVFLAIDNHWTFLFMVTFWGLFSPALIFNSSIMLSYLLLPVLAFLSAKNFNMGKARSLFFLVMTMLLVTGFNFTRLFYSLGMYAYVLSVFLSFYATSLFFKYVKHKRTKDIIKLTAAWSLAFFVHPTAALTCFIFCVPIFIFYSKSLGLKELVRMAASLLVVVIVNLPWIGPLIKFLNYMTRSAGYFQTSPLFLVKLFIGSPIYLFLTALSILSIYHVYNNRSRRFAGSLLCTYLAFFILIFIGSQIGFYTVQPLRFILPLALVSVFAASNALDDDLIKRNILFSGLIVICSISFLKSPVTIEYGYQKSPAIRAICDFIKNDTVKGTRIHVQTAYDEQPYFKSHFTALIPRMTSRPIVAGPHVWTPTKFQFAQFAEDELFGKELKDISRSDLREYSNLYNVGYFLVFSDTARDLFDSNSDFKRVFEFEKFTIYEYLLSDGSYCYRGRADVKAGYNKITVSNAVSPVTVLKYHYIDTLKIDPNTLSIAPVWLLDDPVPFIMVENGDNTDFVIYNE